MRIIEQVGIAVFPEELRLPCRYFLQHEGAEKRGNLPHGLFDARKVTGMAVLHTHQEGRQVRRVAVQHVTVQHVAQTHDRRRGRGIVKMVDSPVANGLDHPLFASAPSAFLDQSALQLAAPLIVDDLAEFRSVKRRFFTGEKERPVISGAEGKSVFVQTELEMSRELGGHLHAAEEKGVGTATAADVVLQSLVRVHHVTEEFEEADEIRLPRTVGTDQDIEAALQVKRFQFPNRFVSRQGNPLQRTPLRSAHTSSCFVKTSALLRPDTMRIIVFFDFSEGMFILCERRGDILQQNSSSRYCILLCRPVAPWQSTDHPAFIFKT